MKIVTLYKYYNPDRLYGGYGWSIKEVFDGWDRIYSDPYLVEIPDDLQPAESVCGETMFFKQDCPWGYELCIGDKHNPDSAPNLIGGMPVETIQLTVVGPAPTGNE